MHIEHEYSEGEQIRWGVEDPPCFKIGYSRSARAESREVSSTPGFVWIRL